MVLLMKLFVKFFLAFYIKHTAFKLGYAFQVKIVKNIFIKINTGRKDD